MPREYTLQLSKYSESQQHMSYHDNTAHFLFHSGYSRRLANLNLLLCRKGVIYFVSLVYLNLNDFA